MSTIGLLTLGTLLVVAGVALALTGVMQPTPSLQRTIKRLQRDSRPINLATSQDRADYFDRQLETLGEFLQRHLSFFPTDEQLLLVRSTRARHAGRLLLGFLVAVFGPPALITLLQTAGLIQLSLFVPLVATLVLGLITVLVLNSAVIDEANRSRDNLRFQLSAYLDVVTMMLAGNAGYEGALEQAAYAGDGRLFNELRRRIRESGARGISLTDALNRTGKELGLTELEQVASTAALSAAEGSPVARTLASKCNTLRNAIASEQETEARLRTSRLTTPLIGMAVIFMALVIYPALNFTL